MSSTFGALRRARARQRSWRWPWDRLEPDSVTGDERVRKMFLFSEVRMSTVEDGSVGLVLPDVGGL